MVDEGNSTAAAQKSGCLSQDGIETEQPQEDLTTSSGIIEKASCNKEIALQLHHVQSKLLNRIQELEHEVSNLRLRLAIPSKDDHLGKRNCPCSMCQYGQVSCQCSKCSAENVEGASSESESAEDTGEDQKEGIDYADEIPMSEGPRSLVIHRVFLSRWYGDTELEPQLYLDQPRYYDHWSGRMAYTAWAGGRKRTFDIKKLLEKHRNISMIIYKDYLPANLKSSSPLWPSYQKGEPNALVPMDSESISVVGDDLYNALLTLAGPESSRYTAFLSSISGSDRLMKAPYAFFYHYKSDVEEAANRVLDEDAQKQFQLIIKHIRDNYFDDYKEATHLFSRKLVTRHHLPKLFRPGDIVVTQDLHPLAYECEEWLNMDTKINPTLKCWSWKFDGALRKEHHIHPIEADPTLETAVQKLTVYPLRMEDSALEVRLRARGEQFWRCRQQRYINYSGWDFRGEQKYETRFMIDIATYRKMHPDAPLFYKSEAPSQQLTGIDDILGDDSKLLLPADIFGFSMSEKKWVDLSVENISEVNWNKTAFDRLVLKTRTKTMIQALVSVHLAAQGTMDIIEGKGNGLIILLHGGPGTGKTLTAESVAEVAEKPLYRVSCGDIGTDAESIENYLETILHIGKIWGCVVLFDEADVFLEERVPADFQRNALVSVFLRSLEYYDGILILTSNRVGHFDEAFKSRIQLSLHYPALVESDRSKIWRVFIKRLREMPTSDSDSGESIDVDDLEDHLTDLAKAKLNGRQIRNAVSTARQMAKFKKETLEYSHLETVIDAAKEFDNYLEEAHGQSDDQWAKETGTRA